VAESGVKGGFPRTAVPGSAEARAEQAARRNAVTVTAAKVEASVSVDEQIRVVLLQHPSWTWVQAENWLWESGVWA
jgi:hypothetical protein